MARQRELAAAAQGGLPAGAPYISPTSRYISVQAVLGEYQEKIAFYFDEVTRFASPFRKGALSLEAWVEVCKGNINPNPNPNPNLNRFSVSECDHLHSEFMVVVRSSASSPPSEPAPPLLRNVLFSHPLFSTSFIH